MKRPLGCLSGYGLIAAAFTLVVALGVTVLAGGTWFSPGRLNAQGGGSTLGGVASHAQTRGNCAACHTAPWSRESMGERCAACHTDVRDPDSHLAQFHALLLRDSPQQPCRACHPEHRGPEASLTEVSVIDFPHESAGFSLAAHARTAAGGDFTCADCHVDNLAAFAVDACDRCHSGLDAAYMTSHRADFGSGCLDCHDGADRFSAFDHADLAFPLEGAHAGLRCGQCHDAAEAADFADASSSCVDCHRDDDAHQGDFGTDCGGCHAFDEWTNATFDHAQTQFPLTGAHQRVGCSSCHAGGQLRRAPAACSSCHEDPAYHRGLFAQTCDFCHNTAAWLPARFDLPHGFPVAHGASAASACRTCHPNALTVYTCYGCHEHDPARIQEEHAEEGIADFGNCVRCHPTGQEDEAEREGDD